MLEKSVTIILCRYRSQCILLHKAKALALLFFFFFLREKTFHLILVFPLTIENYLKEFCRRLFEINTQHHAAVGRERTGSAPWGRKWVLREQEASQQGWQVLGAPEAGLANSISVTSCPIRTAPQSLALWGFSEKVLLRSKSQTKPTPNKPKQGWDLKLGLCFKKSSQDW